MKRNVMLMTAVALALGSAGAYAAQEAEQCANDALQLKMQIEQSNLADADRAKMESSLSEAQGADLARCEQIVERVKREIGASADTTTKDDYSSANRDTANAASAAAGTTEASPSSTTGVPSGTTNQPAAGSDYEPGHATAEETLPQQPGADANSTDPASTTMQDQGYASPEATTEGASSPDNDMSAVGTQGNTVTNPGAATTTMEPIDETAPNPSTSKIAAMTTEDLVDKPVQNANGEEIGEIDAIVLDREANQHAYAVVEYGGMFGMVEKQVVVDLDKLELTADGNLRVPATDEEPFAAYPKYEEKNFQTYQGDLGTVL
jgi:sporulation protein YlmC with PRC-barrel domain